MPKFEIIVTRDTTESTFVTVEAKNEDEAREKIEGELADSESLFGPTYHYERDECATSDPYITHVEESN